MSSESQVIERTPFPAAVDSLARDLIGLGVAPGMTLIVHSALSKLGWVCGGAQAVVLALEQALGPAGTLVMPTFSGAMTEPSEWRNPPVPESWWDTIRATTPAYDPNMTPTRGMGAVVECFRTQEGVVRGPHPTTSFAAFGRLAEHIVAPHPLQGDLGETSPLARLYDLHAHVLLLGVGHYNNTSLHLCEYRTQFPGRKTIRCGSAMIVGGRRQWVSWTDLDLCNEDFDALGADFARETGLEHVGPVGQGQARLTPQRDLVDYGVQWIARHRTAPAST